jgi:hypothetical protein
VCNLNCTKVAANGISPDIWFGIAVGNFGSGVISSYLIMISFFPRTLYTLNVYACEVVACMSEAAKFSSMTNWKAEQLIGWSFPATGATQFSFQ